MLSRTADSLYWLARYIERAENIARIVQVGQHLRVRVLQADRSRRRISLSLKQAEDPSTRPAESEVSDYPGEIERVPEAERERIYAEVSAAPQE